MVLAEWADLIFSMGGLIFGASSFVSVWARAGRAIPLLASIPTMSVLWLYSFTFNDLAFSYTAIVTGTNALLWTILALQRIRAWKPRHG